MTDWADEERARLSRECGCIHSSEPIVLALRKAKADGIMEACLLANDLRFYDKGEFLFSEYWANCSTLATEIEATPA